MFNKSGFTMIELLIVVLIIGVLSAFAIPTVVMSKATAQWNQCNLQAQMINEKLEEHKAMNGSYPALLTEVTESIDYFPDGAPVCPFATAYVFNGGGYRVVKHNHE